MDRPGFTLPKITYLRNLPYVAAAGSCIATDPRGTGEYAYGLFPTALASPNQGWFGRYPLGRESMPGADLWQQLATPAFTATETIDSGTCLIVDPTDGRVWAITADAVGGVFHRWRAYTPATNTWAVGSEVGGTLEAAIPAIIAAITNASLAHPCPTINPLVASDDFLYLAIGNSPVLGRYSKVGNVWAAMGGAARGAAPGAGSSLDFIHGRPDNLYALRGGASNLLDVYTIAVTGWAAGAAVLPGTETFDTGAEAVASPYALNELLVHRQNNVYRIDLARNVIPVASVAGSDGAQHAGHALISYRTGQKWFVGVRLHSKTDFERIEPVL
jgi:hypothetical protein